jgi:hypothetical protein
MGSPLLVWRVIPAIPPVLSPHLGGHDRPRKSSLHNQINNQGPTKGCGHLP